MVELIPFLLFLLEWHEDRPADMVMTRVEALYVDEAACLEAGELLVAEAAAQEGADPKAHQAFSCHAFPDREEFNTMIEQEFGEQDS